MKRSFTGGSHGGLTRIRRDRRYNRIMLIVTSEVPYTKFQNEGGVTPTGGKVSPARFIEDGLRTWIEGDRAVDFRWKT